MDENYPPVEDVRSPTPYLWQVARARRFFRRYWYARDGATAFDGDTFNDIEDLMWAFFQNAWHIKDWIKNDPTIAEEVKRAVVTDVHATESLLLCADLANGSKHFGTAPARDKIGANDQAIELSHGADGRVITDHVIVTGNDQRLTAIELARWVLMDWHAILVRHHLLDPSSPVI